MAKTMPAPWVFNIVNELLKDPAQENLNSKSMTSVMPPSGRPRVVQVLKVHQDENIIVVNDKKHSIAVFLSENCVQTFIKSSNQNISSLENSMIKLEKWHFSTTIQCLGGRNVSILKDLSISTPLTINCSRISSLGAYGCNTIGRPVDINTVPSVRKTLDSMRYISLAERLASRVFGCPRLPDAQGRMLLPTHLYHTAGTGACGDEGEDMHSYVLKLHHCLISKNQRRQLGLKDLHASSVSAVGIKEGSSTAVETEKDTQLDPSISLRPESEEEACLDVSEELEALCGVRGGDNVLALMPQASLRASVTDQEEAASSYAMDMELRETSDEEGGERIVDSVKLVSYDSVMKMQRAMGLRSDTVVSESILNGNGAVSTTTTPPVSQPTSDSVEGKYRENEQGPASQFFFSQNTAFDSESMEDIENLILREGDAMKNNINPSTSLFSSSSHDVIEEPSLSTPSITITDSQQDFLALLSSQNEANKSARPFIHHPPKSTSIRQQDEDCVAETEMATQPQVEYEATPSPPAAASSRKRHGSSEGSVSSAQRHDRRKKAAGVLFANSSEDVQVSPKKRWTIVDNDVLDTGSNGSDSIKENRFQEATQAGEDDDLLCSMTPSHSSSQSSSGYSNSRKSSLRSSSKSNSSSGDEARSGEKYVGRRISKRFKNLGWFGGTVVSYAKPYYLIHYDDGDIERNVVESALRKWLVTETPHASLSSASTQFQPAPPTAHSPLAPSDQRRRGKRRRVEPIDTASSLRTNPTLQKTSADHSSRQPLVSSRQATHPLSSASGDKALVRSSSGGTRGVIGGDYNENIAEKILSANAPDAAKLALRSLFR